MKNGSLPGKAPRSVSMALSLRVRFGSGPALAGFILCGLTMLPVTLLLHSFGVDTETVEGRVTKVSFSGTYYGKHRLDKRPVNRIEFTYRTPDGARHSGHSYGVELEPEPGSGVAVEYPVAFPDIARLRGHSRSVINPWLLLLLLAPALGLFVGLAGIAAGGRRVSLLRLGTAVRGTVVSEELTDRGTGSRPLYRQRVEIEGGPVLSARCTPPRQSPVRPTSDPARRSGWSPGTRCPYWSIPAERISPFP